MSTRDEILALIEAQGKYSIQSEFPEGQNGYAFRALHLPLQRDVFLKICDADSASQEVFKEPIALMQATRGGASANLIELYDAESLGDDFILMAMELATGGSLLASTLAGTIGQMDAVRNGIAILHGASQLHSSGFVHRDIKPANILLCFVGGRLVPKIGDFGSVASISSLDAFVSASRHSALYVPPEGWQDPSIYGIRSDLYQIGLVLHEMVNGALPYDWASFLDNAGTKEVLKSGALNLGDMDACEASLLVDRCLARRSAASKILALRPSRPYQSKRIAKIIKKASSALMEDRYASALEFLTALQVVNLPNWKSTAEGYEATGWKGWDWQLSCAAAPTEPLQLRRRKSSSADYRRWGPIFMSESALFRLVEDFTG